jgi:hypothetical protein
LRRVRAATLTFAAIPLLQFVNIARYSDELAWGSARAWIYVAYLIGLAGLGAYGVRRSWFSRPPVPARRAAGLAA